MSYENLKKSRKILKERIVYVMGERCAICGYSRCKKALEVHHLDPSQKEFGIAQNANLSWEKVKNELVKCVLVCANCHREIHDKIIVNPEKTSFIDSRAIEVDDIVNKMKTSSSFCKNCGSLISTRAVHCTKCAYESRRKSIRPSREELKILIRSTTFTEIANRFGVSDNAIKKWCLAEKLPSKKKEINLYTDQEWDLI